MSERPDAEAESGRAKAAVDAAVAPQTKSPGLVTFFLKRMSDEHISSAAGTLTFSTTLNIVPALALVLASLAAFPAFRPLRDNLQSMIINNMVPDSGLKVSETLNGFVEAAGKLTAFGVIGLATTAIVLLLTIEGQLNLIFHVSKPRPIALRLLVFWAVLTAGPVLLGLGFSLFGYFSALPFLEKTPGGSAIAVILGHALPTILTWIVVTLIFLLLPNRRIQRSDAVIGAAFAALLLAVLRYTFAFYIVMATSYRAIYGALAAVPVFLMWIYLIWLFVTAGAVITASLPDWRSARAGFAGTPIGRVVLSLEIIARLAGLPRERAGLTRGDLVKSVGVPDALLTVVLEVLMRGRFVAYTDTGLWVLSRDLERTTLADLVGLFGLGLDFEANAQAFNGSEVARKLCAHLRSAADSERAALSISLSRLATLPAEPAAAS
jgi:membrane protein